MKRVAVLVDSVCGLSPQLAAGLGIRIIPYYCNFKGTSFKEGASFDRLQFYKNLRTVPSDEYPTTSGPTFQDLIDAYALAAQEADELVHLTLSSHWTKTYELAHKVKAEFSKIRIEVVDSQVAVGSLGFLAIESAKVTSEGGSIEQILERIEEVKPRRDTVVVFETLKYLARGGRIGKAKALVGTILSIKPILGIKDGMAVPLAKVTTNQQGLNWIVAKIRSAVEKLKGERIEVIIEDIDNQKWTTRAKERLCQEFTVDRLYESAASVIIGTHVGPGSWGVSWFIP